MKTKKLVKKALKKPELDTNAELIYMRKWLAHKKAAKISKQQGEK
jgi:hypothetical protein